MNTGVAHLASTFDDNSVGENNTVNIEYPKMSTTNLHKV